MRRCKLLAWSSTHGCGGRVVPGGLYSSGSTPEDIWVGGDRASPPWYKFEMPCPLVRPNQTHLGRSARAPVDRGPWGFGEGVVGSDHPGNRVPAPPWYKFKMPCPLVRPSQTRLGHPARTPADCIAARVVLERGW